MAPCPSATNGFMYTAHPIAVNGTTRRVRAVALAIRTARAEPAGERFIKLAPDRSRTTPPRCRSWLSRISARALFRRRAGPGRVRASSRCRDKMHVWATFAARERCECVYECAGHDGQLASAFAAAARSPPRGDRSLSASRRSDESDGERSGLVRSVCRRIADWVLYFPDPDSEQGSRRCFSTPSPTSCIAKPSAARTSR